MRRALAVVGMLALAGCAAGEPAAPEPAESPTASLAELRVQYGIPECPDSDPDAVPVDGGLPATELECLGTDQVVNLAGLPREPMVINLWAQWCAPCRLEAPYLREAAAAHPEVTFLGIDYNDPKPDWALEFASLVEWDYPHAMDMDKTLRTELQVPGIPMTILVDAEGRIVARHPGVLESTEQLDQLIEEHL